MAAAVEAQHRQSTAATIGRRGSFSDVEKFCLRALLLDSPEKPLSSHEAATTQPLLKNVADDKKVGRISEATKLRPSSPSLQEKRIDDTVLFQLPFPNTTTSRHSERRSTTFGRHEKKILGLWQAHSDGVHPIVMQKRKSSTFLAAQNMGSGTSSRLTGSDNPQAASSDNDEDDDASVRSSASAVSGTSDAEVRPLEDHDDNSSWGETDGGFVHYNAWEVLKDEYAEDFGFDFKENIHSITATLEDEDDDCQAHVFRILGTAADDLSAQPHVLSPPLMDSLLNFVPDSISMENYWMKFSLIRDGASLFTLKNYIKAAPYTLLAIETTKGEVFGSFTSQTWRNHPTFYGNAPAFLWRMRHNRRTPCHSLYDQAQMESEIDVYSYSGLNDLVQVCDEDRIAIGGGKLVPDWDGDADGGDADGGTRESRLSVLKGVSLESLDAGENFGFGIALDEDLLGGTTSPCGTFRNPCLIDNLSKGEVFQVANLEAWTFTPCIDVKSAERMEMTRYFVEESVRSIASTNSSKQDIYSNPFSSQEDYQKDFYRRVGQNQPTGHQRKGSFEFRHVVAPSSRR